jgi:hypothetical protein
MYTGFLREEPEWVNLLRSPGIDSQPGGILFLESISGLLKRLQTQVQVLLLTLESTQCSTQSCQHRPYTCLTLRRKTKREGRKVVGEGGLEVEAIPTTTKKRHRLCSACSMVMISKKGEYSTSNRSKGHTMA